MKRVCLYVCCFIAMAISALLFAVPPGMNIEFKKSPLGKVVFDGKFHADKGIKYEAYHPKLFQEKNGNAKIKFPDHMAGQKYCFACHNGKIAFVSKDDCQKCHKKRSSK